MLPNFLLRQEVLVYKYLGDSAYGGQYEEEPTRIKCRFEPVYKHVRGAQGNDLTITAQMFVNPTVNINKGSKVVYLGTEYFVEQVVPMHKASPKPHHFEITLVS